MNPRRIVKALIPRSLFRMIEPYGHLLESVAFNLLNGFPARGLKVIGVTGTNGKTTTAFMIQRMLSESGYKSGLMSTVAWGIDADITPQIQHYTNVPVPELMKRMKVMRQAKVDYVVMEVTSQALAQNRVWGVPFSLAVMTNVTHEHLDYHGTFENYLNAKRRLFKLANRNRSGYRTGVVNADDPNANLFVHDVTNPVTYGLRGGDIKAKNLKLTAQGSTYETEFDRQKINVRCNLPGSFNVYNSLAVVCVGCVLGLTPKQIEQGIAALDSVEGRMTTINAGQDFSVIVDFAHTPDSFEKLFKDFKSTLRGKLIVVFGSAGRRDAAKRAVQGKLAGKYADYVVITEEDDRDMDGQEIMEQIAEGAKKAGKKLGKDLFMVHKREEAIEQAFKLAKAGDTVMLLGKGHENSILSNGPKAAQLRHLKQDDDNLDRVIARPYNEEEAAKRALKKLNLTV